MELFDVKVTCPSDALCRHLKRRRNKLWIISNVNSAHSSVSPVLIQV